MVAADLAKERTRFQNFHLIVHLKDGQDPSIHPQFDALGREFDLYNPEHREAIALELKTCETTMKTCNSARSNFKGKEDQFNHFEAKGYPGGAAQQRKEILGLAQYCQNFIETATKLRQDLVNLGNIQRRYGACSTFVYTSVDQLNKIVVQHIKDAKGVRDNIKGRIASLQDAKPVDPAKERKERKRKLREQVKKGDIDYVAPLLGSNGAWVFVDSIGEGMGSASLWARVDDSGAVQERVVRKDTQMSPFTWNDARFWVVDSKVAQGKTHLEYHCHAKAYKQPNGSNIVKPRKFEFDDNTLTIESIQTTVRSAILTV